MAEWKMSPPLSPTFQNALPPLGTDIVLRLKVLRYNGQKAKWLSLLITLKELIFIGASPCMFNEFPVYKGTRLTQHTTEYSPRYKSFTLSTLPN